MEDNRKKGGKNKNTGGNTSRKRAGRREPDPEDMSQGALSRRVRYLKKEEGGQKIMCEVMDRIREEGRKEGRKEGRAEERVNTARERNRANRERNRAEAAERKVRELEERLMYLQTAGSK